MELQYDPVGREDFPDDPAARVVAGRDLQPGLGKRLREYRVRQGLSQTDLAGDTLSPSAVSLLESGRRVPTARTLEILAHRLGCTVEYLRDGVSPEATTLGILRLLRAELALRSGSPAAADELLREVGVTACGNPLPEQRSRYTQALVKERLGAFDEAVTLLEELVRSTEEGGGWVSLSVALARCYRKAGQISRSIETAQGALARMADLGLADVSEQAETRTTLMLALSEAGMTAEALVHARDSLEAGQLPSWACQAKTYDQASRQAEQAGRLAEAVWLTERGVSLLSTCEGEVMVAKLRTASASLLMRGSGADASGLIEVLTEAHKVLLAYGSPAEVGRCEVELARAMLRSDAPEAAVTWAERALAHLVGEQDVSLAWGRLAMGRGLLALQRAAAALAETEAATALLRAAPSSVETAQAWREAGELLRELHQETAALDALSQALAAVGVGQR